jgi:hypothetical protein
MPRLYIGILFQIKKSWGRSSDYPTLRLPNPAVIQADTYIIHFPYNRGLLSIRKGSHWHTDTRTELRSRVHSRCQE